MTGRRRTGRHNSRRRWTVTDASPSISPALRIKRKDRGTGSQSGSQTAQPTSYDHGRARSTDRSFEREGRPAGPVRTLSRDLRSRWFVSTGVHRGSAAQARAPGWFPCEGVRGLSGPRLVTEPTFRHRILVALLPHERVLWRKSEPCDVGSVATDAARCARPNCG
jgi:hypothetical protein